MYNSKKADGNILLLLFALMIMSVILILGIIFSYVIYVAGHDGIVLTLYDVGVASNQSDLIQGGFENTVESYEDIELNSMADNIFFFAYAFMSMIAYAAAYNSRGSGFFSFLSMLTFGVMFVLYIFSFFLIVMSWLYFDVLLNLFINFVPNLPKLEWFVTNGGLVFLVQATSMLLLKVVDLDMRSWGSRKKAENQYNDDLTQ